MKALDIFGGLILLVAALYVAFSDAAQQFGVWGFALAIVSGVIVIRKQSGPWMRVGVVGLAIGTAAFAGCASSAMS